MRLFGDPPLVNSSVDDPNGDSGAAQSVPSRWAVPIFALMAGGDDTGVISENYILLAAFWAALASGLHLI